MTTMTRSTQFLGDHQVRPHAANSGAGSPRAGGPRPWLSMTAQGNCEQQLASHTVPTTCKMLNASTMVVKLLLQ
ncbi:hypothetical protein ZEAMMB73_Zm00001d037746 [Zea mays]|uniref:Uncharacterized protein n=1 Tax=Zea mays TaxID=4577 RepID=A0A1D6M081_MAIZE|nr:hypothetical protein ZEAMMB73_Zm00001d037746 [Zea mays]